MITFWAKDLQIPLPYVAICEVVPLLFFRVLFEFRWAQESLLASVGFSFYTACPNYQQCILSFWHDMRCPIKVKNNRIPYCILPALNSIHAFSQRKKPRSLPREIWLTRGIRLGISHRYPISGGIQGWVGWDLGQPDLLGATSPQHGVTPGWSRRSFPT